MTPHRAETFVIRRAGVPDVVLVAPLFDAYRQFYDRSAEPAAARAFISDRLRNGDSVIFVAIEGSGHAQRAIGFVQLFPTFTSVDVGRLWLLNDLYVAQSARGRGIGKRLLETAIHHARESGAIRLQLETMADNAAARALYESTGWEQIEGSCFYNYWLATTSGSG